jgi:flavoprotein
MIALDSYETYALEGRCLVCHQLKDACTCKPSSVAFEKCVGCGTIPCHCPTEQEDPDKQYGDDDGYGEYVNYPSS